MTAPALTDLHDDEKMFQEAIAAFAHDRIAPKVAAMDEASKVDPALFEELFGMGLMGIEIPEKFGGAGSSFFSAILAIEALARVDASVSVVVDVQNTLVNNAILRWGNDDQKAKYLPKMTSEWVGSYALSEAGSGSDAFALKTRAELQGGHYVLNGSKLWITNGGEASLFIVMANVDPSQGYKGITSFPLLKKERLVLRLVKKRTN